MKAHRTAICLAVALAYACAIPAIAADQPWMNTTQTPDQRADALVAAMTLPEKIQTVYGFFSTDAEWKHFTHPKEGRHDSAGYVPGIERLGFPAQWETDAGVGVATQAATKAPYERTSLPSGLATAATWNPQLAFAGGAMIGDEARRSGYNVMLAGGVNLMRDPRNGRNFEYGGEDPLLAGVMVGSEIAGIQSAHVISTVKHFAFNDQETNRFHVHVQLNDAAARMSDLLAFQLAIERGDPGAVMCSYNRVGKAYACENGYLLNEVLKQDWGYRGYVMSDWGATHSTIPAALSGLDQQSGNPFDLSPYYDGALKEAVINGHVPEARLNDMVHRIARSMFANGAVDHAITAIPEGAIDFNAHAGVTQADAEEAIVLLKNRGALLPLQASVKSIAVIGAHADVGVLSGGGSSQVYPVGGMAVPNEGPTIFPGPMVYDPSSPMRALAQGSKARIVYNDGKDIAAAAKLAADSDVVIVFATQWAAESVDVPSLALSGKQDELIAALAHANGKTVVVLESGGPVAMPWLDKVGAVVEAWYPGTSGGAAIARVLTGAVNPSGHLPATFPAAESQLPRQNIVAAAEGAEEQASVDYNIEGAAVGYKWYDLKQYKPLFAFGYGLSYTSFGYSGLAAQARDGSIAVTFTTKNTGARAGKAVPQVYVAAANGGWEAPKRLAGWDKLALKPGASGKSELRIDPRLLGVYDSASKTWKIAEGDYLVILAESATAPVSTVKVHLAARTLDVRGH